MKYIGVDLHKQYFVTTVMNEHGDVLNKHRVSTDRESIRKYFNKIASGDCPTKVAMEACYNWSYMYDQIEGLVDEIQLAHPLKTRLIAEARIKTDSIDSEILAHLLRADLIAKAHIPDSTTRAKKNLLRYRSSLVSSRRTLKNRIHAVLSRNHIENKEFGRLSDKFGKRGMSYMRSFKLKGNDTQILNDNLDLIEEFNKKIKEAEKRITEVFKEDEICRLLQTIPGIGYILSVTIRYEIDKIERFISSKKLVSYSGLIPSTYSTGGKTYQGRITKQGNKWLRYAFVEAAQSAIRYDPWLGSVYKRIAAKRGDKRARVAVARKILEIVYRVWNEKSPYYENPVAVAL